MHKLTLSKTEQPTSYAQTDDISAAEAVSSELPHVSDPEKRAFNGRGANPRRIRIRKRMCAGDYAEGDQSFHA